MNLKDVGMRIKHCRQLKNWTQEEFAEMIDVSPHYIYEIERGLKRMSLRVLDNIATTLNVSADYLLYGSRMDMQPDELSMLVDNLPPDKRECIAEVISALLPFIK